MSNVPEIKSLSSTGDMLLGSKSVNNFKKQLEQIPKSQIEELEDIDVLEETFDEIKGSISSNAEAALNREYVKISDEYEKYWTDSELKFVYHEGTGTYQIQQLDENGSWVVMGYTTKEAHDKYLKKISDFNDNEQPIEDKQSTEDKQPIIFNTESAGIKTMFKDEVPQYVNQELENYMKNCIIDGIKTEEPFNEKHSSYDNLSDITKQIIDGKILVREKELTDYILTLEDYKIPDGKNLVVPNSLSSAMAGEVLKYNSKTNKYHVYKNGEYSSTSFEIEDLKNAELKEGVYKY